MHLHEWYDKGLTPAEYMNRLEKHRENFMNIYNNFSIVPGDPFIKELQEKNLRAIVLAEVWCGHCMLDIPIFLHIAINAGLPVSFLPRDENLALMDQYLTNEKSRTVPIIIFIDENGNEVHTWGPVAPKVKEFTKKYQDKLPEKDAPTYDEKFQEMIQIVSKEFAENKTLWNAVYEDMKKAIR